MPLLDAGLDAPDFQLPDVEGQPHRLADWTACGPVVLYFYKVECPTSALAMPVAQKLHDDYGGRGAAVVGVAQDSAVDVLSFTTRLGAHFEQLLDAEPYVTSDFYGIATTPTLYLIDRDGRIRMSAEGWSRDRYNEAARHLSEVLAVEYTPVSTEDDGLPALRPG